MDLSILVDIHKRDDYQRDNFDKFLKKTNFAFAIPSVHVTGTNGKGSTCYYLANIFKENGYKVGLYNSPYFYDTNEMISINGNHISDEELLSIFNQYKVLFDKYSLSIFEIETFIAFEYFKSQKCDVCIIECGMGGELDATNIFTPTLSIITSVSIEHTNFLGKSINEIALHKAGIIKYAVPVLIGDLSEEAEATIALVAKQNKSQVYKPAPASKVMVGSQGVSFSYSIYSNMFLSSGANYEVHNARLALEATLILGKHFQFDTNNVRFALKNTQIPCRFEILGAKPTLVFDGGHNPEAIRSLIDSMRRRFSGQIIHTIFACFRDKNISLMLPDLHNLSSDLTLTTFDHPRARTAEEYFLFLDDYKFVDSYQNLLKNKIEEFPNDVILITGSLAFVSLVKKDYLEGKIIDGKHLA